MVARSQKVIRKAFLWCKHHWKAVLLAIAFVAVYILGKRKGNNLLNMAKEELKLYKEKSEKVEQSHKEHVEDVKQAKVKYEESLRKLMRSLRISKQCRVKRKRKK